MNIAAALQTPLVETLEVTQVACEGQLAGRGVETPAPDSSQDGYLLPISGWVHASPATATHVHVVSEGRAIASAAVLFERPDVAAHLAVAQDTPMGFLTDVSVLELPLDFELRLEVELSDGRQFAFAAVSGRRRALQPRFQPTLRPTFVTNIGRCGSTLMMDLLRYHPRIVVHDLYPYETRALSYWTHMFKVLSGPANHLRSASPNTYEDDSFWVGRHPHNMRPVIEPGAVRDFLRRDYVDRLAEFCQASTDEFYRSVCEAQGVDEPVYFAEKRNPRASARIASELYPDAREIFLVRDPRDMLCSMISFYEKTQLVSFGRETGVTDEAFVRRIGDAVRDLVVHVRERGEQAIVVRYEDLVGDTAATLANVLEYLDLPTRVAQRRSIVSQARASTTDSRRHRTSADDRASVGRWRRDLSEPMKQLCGRAFGELADELGYEL
jgi:hypothetical protein